MKSLRLFVWSLPCSVLVFSILFVSFAAASDLPVGKTVSRPALEVLDGLHLRDQSGHPFTHERLAGKVVLLDFVFTNCVDSCPLQTEQFAQLQRDLPKSLRKRVALVSVSVDPERDSPVALKRYAAGYRADYKLWSFVTGSPADIQTLAHAFDATADPAVRSATLTRHSSDVRLIDANGRVVQRYAGVRMDRERVLRELQDVAAAPAPGTPQR